MTEQEHYLKEAPYVVMDAGKKGYGAQCICGWRSVLYDTEEELQAVVREHLANPPEPVRWRFWQRRKRNPFGGAYDRRN